MSEGFIPGVGDEVLAGLLVFSTAAVFLVRAAADVFPNPFAIEGNHAMNNQGNAYQGKTGYYVKDRKNQSCGLDSYLVWQAVNM